MLIKPDLLFFVLFIIIAAKISTVIYLFLLPLLFVAQKKPVSS